MVIAAPRVEKPKKEKCRRKVKNFFWNPAEKTCCTRTPKNWLAIFIYYLCFCSVIVGLFILTITVVTLMASQDKPQYYFKDSPLSIPGMCYFPNLMNNTPLIMTIVNGSNENYVDLISSNLKKYPNLENLSDCSKASYGYDEHKPCVYLILNKVFEFKPKLYNSSNQLPDIIPPHLKTKIMSDKTDNIYFFCVGRNPTDREKLPQSSINFYPNNTLASSWFPIKNTVDPMPLIAVQFFLNVTDTVITVGCYAWNDALDIKISKLELILYAN